MNNGQGGQQGIPIQGQGQQGIPIQGQGFHFDPITNKYVIHDPLNQAVVPFNNPGTKQPYSTNLAKALLHD